MKIQRNSGNPYLKIFTIPETLPSSLETLWRRIHQKPQKTLDFQGTQKYMYTIKVKSQA